MARKILSEAAKRLRDRGIEKVTFVKPGDPSTKRTKKLKDGLAKNEMAAKHIPKLEPWARPKDPSKTYKVVIPEIEGEAELAIPLLKKGDIGWRDREEKMNAQERAEQELAFHAWTPWRDVADLFPGTPSLLANAGTKSFYSTIMRRCKACGEFEERSIGTPFDEIRECKGAEV